MGKIFGAAAGHSSARHLFGGRAMPELGNRGLGGLGRGLGALIPSAAPAASAVPPAGSPIEVPVEAIERNPRQPRLTMDPTALAELAASIREHGLLQPIVVSRRGGEPARYELIAGQRRLEASRLAGLTAVPVIFREATPEQSLELALVENIQRSDLNPLEEAAAYQQLMTEFGLTQEQVATKVGKSRSAVANSLRLLGLPDDVKAAVTRGEVSEGHARALLGLKDESDRRAALGEIVRDKLSVRSTEDLVRERAEARERRSAEKSVRDEIRALEDAFRTALGTRVSLVRRGEGGQLIIHFYSDEQLQALYEALVKE
jgi:ParB family chromosome partitioning protein